MVPASSAGSPPVVVVAGPSAVAATGGGAWSAVASATLAAPTGSRAGQPVSPIEHEAFASCLMLFFGRLDAGMDQVPCRVGGMVNLRYSNTQNEVERIVKQPG
jgi:hypothetical protein